MKFLLKTITRLIAYLCRDEIPPLRQSEFQFRRFARVPVAARSNVRSSNPYGRKMHE